MAKDAKKTVTLDQLSAVATKVKTWGKNNFVEDVTLTSGKIQKVINGTATDVVTIPTSLPNPNSLKLQAGGTDKVTYDGSSSATLNIASGSSNGTISVGGTDVSVTGLGSLAYLNSLSASDVNALPSTTNYAGSSTAGGAATSAAKLTNTSKVGDTNKPVYFTAQGVPAAVTHTLDADVPEGAVFTDTHYTATPVAGESSATSNATSDTADPYINIVENGSKSGGVQVKGTGATSVSAKDGIITVNSTNTTYDEVTTTTAGLMSAADKVKLNGIATGATADPVNNGTFSVKTKVGDNSAVTAADFTANQNDADDVTFIQGTNVTLTTDTTNRTITIAATDTTYGTFGSSANGLAPSTASGNVTTAETSSTVNYLCSDGKWRPLPEGAWKTGTVTSTSHTITVVSGKKSDGSTDITATSSSATSPSVTLGDSGAIAGSYGDSANQTPSNGSTFKVPYVTVNAKGIVTGISDHTVTMPTNADTVDNIHIVKITQSDYDNLGSKDENTLYIITT